MPLGSGSIVAALQLGTEGWIPGKRAPHAVRRADRTALSGCAQPNAATKRQSHCDKRQERHDDRDVYLLSGRDGNVCGRVAVGMGQPDTEMQR